MLTLADAVFERDSADLLPAARACVACPKRTRANTALFDDFAEDAAAWMRRVSRPKWMRIPGPLAPNNQQCQVTFSCWTLRAVSYAHTVLQETKMLGHSERSFPGEMRRAA